MKWLILVLLLSLPGVVAVDFCEDIIKFQEYNGKTPLGNTFKHLFTGIIVKSTPLSEPNSCDWGLGKKVLGVTEENIENLQNTKYLLAVHTSENSVSVWKSEYADSIDREISRTYKNIKAITGEYETPESPYPKGLKVKTECYVQGWIDIDDNPTIVNSYPTSPDFYKLEIDVTDSQDLRGSGGCDDFSDLLLSEFYLQFDGQHIGLGTNHQKTLFNMREEDGKFVADGPVMMHLSVERYFVGVIEAPEENNSDTQNCSCNYEDECKDTGFRANDSFCAIDGFVEQKFEGSICNFDYECRTNICNATCVSNKSEIRVPDLFECHQGTKGFQEGERTELSYCTSQGWEVQKLNGETCAGDYECVSNRCEGTCKTNNFFLNIGRIFRNFFT